MRVRAEYDIAEEKKSQNYVSSFTIFIWFSIDELVK